MGLGCCVVLKCPEWLAFFIKQLFRSKKTLLAVSLLTALIALCGAAVPIAIGRIVDGVALQGGEGLGMLAVVLLGSLLVIEVCDMARSYYSGKAMLRLTYDLTRNTLASVLRTRAGFFAETPRGELLQRCVQDTRAVQQFAMLKLPGTVQELLLAATGIVVICGIYWPIALVIAVSYIGLYIPIHRFGRKRGAARQLLTKHDARLKQSLLEKLESLKQIKLFGTEKREYERFRTDQDRWAELSFQEGIVDDLYRGFPRIPDALAPAVVFLLGGWQAVQGRVTVGQLMTIIAFVPAINAPVRSMFTLYTAMADIRVRIGGILEYLRLPAEPGITPGLLRQESCRSMPIVFDGIGACGERGSILRNVSFTVAPGEHVAVVGPSGAGKSTLLQLIARLREPSKGEIRFGEMPLRMIDATHVRKRIGYMTQEVFLFNDSLYRNLTYLIEDGKDCGSGREDQAGEGRMVAGDRHRAVVEQWMAALGAEDIVSSLADGYDTPLGDKGSLLSGGQRQLIGLARTLAKQPDLLLLDEATSSLDQASEALVYEALDKHASGMTRISVTHRLKGARYADRIVVLDEGEIVQQGTHDELIRHREGLYARLWFGEEEGVVHEYATV